MSVTSAASPGADRRALVRKLSTYAASSVVATVCSELTLVVAYGLLHVPAAIATVVAWLAGAVPNYFLNRSYTWRRTGRPSLRRELLPYVGIVLATLLIAGTTTHLVSAATRGQPDATRTTLVAITFFGVYIVMFVVRYALFDRLFARLAASRATAPDLIRYDTTEDGPRAMEDQR